MPRGVRCADGVGHFARDAQRVVDRQLPLPVETRAQCFASDERHHVVQQPVGGARVEQRQDMRMLQLGGDLDLTQKPLGPERRAQVGM